MNTYFEINFNIIRIINHKNRTHFLSIKNKNNVNSKDDQSIKVQLILNNVKGDKCASSIKTYYLVSIHNIRKYCCIHNVRV